MGYIKNQPWFTSLMDKGDTLGACPNCGKTVREYQFTLDDCYGVYRGRCPHCNALCLLKPQKYAGRGYTSKEMFLTLPTDYEIEMNGWEKDVPTIKCACKTCAGGGK